jgi:hypothetical protein
MTALTPRFKVFDDARAEKNPSPFPSPSVARGRADGFGIVVKVGGLVLPPALETGRR